MFSSKRFVWIILLGFLLLVACQVDQEDVLPTSTSLITSTIADPIEETVPPTEVSPVIPTPSSTPLPPSVVEIPSSFQGNLPAYALAQYGQGDFHFSVPSPDDTRLAIASSNGVLSCDTTTLAQLWVKRIGDVSKLEWSPDGTKIAITLEDESVIYILDGFSGEIIYEMTSHESYITSLAWAPTSDRLLSTEENGIGIIWDFTTDTPPIPLMRENYTPEDIAGPCIIDASGELSPDGKLYATSYIACEGGVWDWRSVFAVWDAVTGTPIRLIEGYNVLNLIWLDHERVMVFSYDDVITVWNAITGELLSELEGSYDIKLLSIGAKLNPSPDHQFLIIENSFEIPVLDMLTGRLLYALPFGESLITWHPDGQLFATFDKLNNVVIVHRAEDGAEVNRITNVAQMDGFSSDWNTLYGWSGADARTLTKWDMNTGHPESVVIGSPSFYSVSWSPDGNYIAAGISSEYDRAAEVFILDTHTAEVTQTFNITSEEDGFLYNLIQVAWSPDGTMIAAVSNTGAVWNVETGEMLTEFDTGIYSLVWSPDSMYLATSDQYEVSIINAYTGEKVLTFAEHESRGENMVTRVSSVDWSDDGQWIASGATDQVAMVWDAKTGEVIMRYKYPLDEYITLDVPAVAISPNGQYLAVGTSQDYYRIYDEVNGKYDYETVGSDVYIVEIETGEVVYQLDSIYTSVGSIDWSPDGTEVAVSFGPRGFIYGSAGGWDNSASPVLIWDMQTGKLRYTLTGHTMNAHSVRYSPDGDRIASASLDGSVLIWDIEE